MPADIQARGQGWKNDEAASADLCQLETQPRALRREGAVVGGGFHKGPFLVCLLFGIVLSKLFLVTDDTVDYENSMAIHTWKLQQGQGAFPAVVGYLGMGLMGRLPGALAQYRPRQGNTAITLVLIFSLTVHDKCPRQCANCYTRL